MTASAASAASAADVAQENLYRLQRQQLLVCHEQMATHAQPNLGMPVIQQPESWGYVAPTSPRPVFAGQQHAAAAATLGQDRPYVRLRTGDRAPRLLARSCNRTWRLGQALFAARTAGALEYLFGDASEVRSRR